LAYFFLAHGCGDCISNDAAHLDDLKRIGLKIIDEFVDLILCRPPIAFDASANKVEVAQRYSGQTSFFGRDFNAMNCCGVRYDRPNEG
jgi:hypothetical protein